jgi:acyl-CoA reductase-like NAD-dependent aldehyde dehydrogenase
MEMLIGGQWKKASDGAWGEIRNPGNGELIDKVPMATLQDAEDAVASAQIGKQEMRRLTAHERYTILTRIAELIEAHEKELGFLLARENGKPVLQTRAEVGVTANVFRGFAEEGKRMFGRVIPVDAVQGHERHFAFTIRQPIGVVAAIIPFNYPVELWGHKAAAALAAGNALITKPPSACPLTLLRIAELMLEAGLPINAHQILTGSGVMIGEFLAKSEGIQALTVTGSTPVGKRISELASVNLKKLHMELGGNDAMIILADADIDKAVDSVILGRLARGNGQICCAVKRIFVEATIINEFTNLLVERTKHLKVGDQLLEDTDVGPLINEKAAREVEEFINMAVASGAKIMAGGKRNKAFIEPTVLTNVTVDMPAIQEEIFGPVAPLIAFDSLEEAIRLVNASPYGLQAAVFTSDVSKALDTAYKLEAGGVIVNWSTALRIETLPFGGIKLSGQGREGIHDTLEEMTVQKAIVVHNAFLPK